MTLEPLTSAALPIQFHAFAAIAAFCLGAAQLFRTKGNRSHRIAGYTWVALMLIIAVSGLFIHEIRLIGPFSPIHLLSLLILVSVPLAVLGARKGDIKGHGRAMTSIFWMALVLAGVFTLLPGRIMERVVFGP